MLGIECFILSFEARYDILFGCILDLFLDRLQTLFDLRHAGLIVIAQFTASNVIIVEAFGLAVGNMLGEDDTNPSKGAELHEFSCNLFEFRPRELLCNRTIKPLALAVASEQVPLNASTGSQIVCFADKLRYSAGRLDRAVCDITPDCVGLVALPAAIKIVPGGKLYIDIGGAAICLSDVEGDLAFGKGIENRSEEQ